MRLAISGLVALLSATVGIPPRRGPGVPAPSRDPGGRSTSRRAATGRILLLCVTAGAVGACGDAFFAPGARLPASLSFALSVAAGGPEEAFDRADAAAVRVRRGAEVVLDTVVQLTHGAEEHRIRLPIELGTEQEQLLVSIELRGAGARLFQWEGLVTLRRGAVANAEAELEPIVVRLEVPDSVPLLTAIGDTVRLRATGFFATGDTVRSSSIAWSSVGAAIAVDRSGVLVSIDNGEARIVAHVGGTSDTVHVRVQQQVHAVGPAAAGDSVFTGFESRYAARDRRGVLMRTPVTWTSQDTTVADVGAAGVVYGKRAGTVVVSAAAGGTTAQAPVRVAETPRASVQVGRHHTCGLEANGTVRCWGHNGNGQLGTRAVPWIGGTQPALVEAGVAFDALVVGPDSNCGLTAAGAAYCWGYNRTGQLGAGFTMPTWPHGETTPRQVVGGHSFSRLALGGEWPQQEQHACGVTDGGQVLCWGGNGYGQLGNGSTTPSDVPEPVAGSRRYREIGAGYGFTCAIAEDGRAFCWGRNDVGQLGTGTTGAGSPVPVEVVGGHQFASLDLGRDHACAITRSHELYCWGSNHSGALGTGTFGGTRSEPVAIAPQLRFLTVSAGALHSCATTTAAEAWCWGDNHTGRLGTGGPDNSPGPVRIAGGTGFRSISAGNVHTCGVDATGTARCWGDRGHGQLGSGSVGFASVPIPVSGGRSFSSIATGQGFACAVDAAHAGFCWGINFTGQLGTGTVGRDGFLVPTPVQGGLSFQSIAAGMNHACGLASDGAAHCWGSNSDRQLGAGVTAGASLTPAAVSGGLTFTQLSAGRLHTCGINTAGRAFCWGANESGQLGDGSTSRRDMPTPVAGGLTFTSISAAGWHTCGVTSGGQGYCWGDNSSGQLGDGSRTRSLVPVAVVGGERFREIEAARNFWSSELAYSCGVTESGELFCWGISDGCRLGNGRCDNTLQLTPGPVLEGSGFRAVSSSAAGSCAVSVSGAGYCWGSNFTGEMGIGHRGELIGATNSDPGSGQPRPMAGGLTFRSISASSQHVCGVTTNGAAYCWGQTQWGALGNGALQWVLAPRPVEGVLFQ